MENTNAKTETVTVLKTEYDQMLEKMASLTEYVTLLRRRIFGASSESFPLVLTVPEQISLFDTFNEAEATVDLTVPETEEITYTRKKTRLTTDRLPKDLLVDEIVHELPENEQICPCCDGKLHVMGNATRDELVTVPAKMYIRRHIQNTYACRYCENNAEETPIIKAEMPKPVIKGGFASPESVAHIAYQKFIMGSPLYRQEQEWKANGIDLSRQTMSNWLIKACELWLLPIYDELKRRLCTQDVAHADETTLQVLKEDGKTAQSKSYMWLYRTSGCAKEHVVLFEYQPDRRAIHPAKFLAGFSGFLHTDGYAGYHNLPENITVVGCWAHLRRKFDEAITVLPKEIRAGSAPAKGLAYCNKLFHLEKQFSSLTPEKRQEERDLQSKPIAEEFYKWVDSVHALPKSALGKATGYAVTQKKYLMNFFEDGRLELSNNRAENAIRPFVMGRKNWLFSNVPNGAKTSAVFYSLIATAKENGLHPFEYLTKVFTHAPNGVAVELLLPFGV